MKHSKGLILLCIVATVGLMGCPDDDDDVIPGPPGPAAAEAAIENVLDTVVDPLLLAIEAITDYMDTFSKSTTRAACPDTSTACSPGTLSCAPTTLGWDFTFTGCTVVGSAPALGLDGGVEVTPTGLATFILAMDNLSVNGSTGLTGTVEFTAACTSEWNVGGGDAFLVGDIVACDEDNPAAGSTLVMTIQGVGTYIVDISFDGTNMANALVTLDLSPIATCLINLDTFDTSCSAVTGP